MRLRTCSVLLAMGLAGCAGGSLPWRKAPPPEPAPVRELVVTVPTDAPMPLVLQYWERNTLVVDLGSVSPRGSVQLEPGPSGWPARLAVRFTPGRFEALEVRGGQRVVYPATSVAGPPATVEVPPAVHAGGVTRLTLMWGGAAEF